MSILSALKAKGAKGKNIEEAVKTLPASGGGDGGVLVVDIINDEEQQTATLNKTWQQIFDAPLAVTRIYEHETDPEHDMYSVEIIEYFSIEGNEYTVDVGSSVYTATDPNGYPSTSTK